MIKTKIEIGNIVSLQSLSDGIAGDIQFYHRYLIGKKRIKEVLGLKPIESKNSLKGMVYISQNPDKRALDLMDAIEDKSISGIFANIGGIDSYKLWDYIDLNKIRMNPKVLIGYSDTTSLHFMFYKAGVQSFYGPSVLDGFAENVKMHEYTLDSLRKALFSFDEQIIKSSPTWTSEFLDWTNRDFNKVSRKMNDESHGFITLNKQDNVEGHLLGGCLDTIIQIKNKEFFPKIEEWKNAIMFLESSEQKMGPDEFESALDLLKEEISVCSGIIFGKPKDEAYFEEYLNIIKRKINKPVFYNVNFGHTAPMITIPYGGNCQLDFNNLIIRISK